MHLEFEGHDRELTLRFQMASAKEEHSVSRALAKCKVNGEALSILPYYMTKEESIFSPHSFISFRSREASLAINIEKKPSWQLTLCQSSEYSSDLMQLTPGLPGHGITSRTTKNNCPRRNSAVLNTIQGLGKGASTARN